MDILDEVGKYISEDETINDITEAVDDSVTLANITTDNDGKLIQAPWMAKDVGDMTVEELEESIKTSVPKDSDKAEKMSVADIIKMMNDSDTNVDFMNAGKPRKSKIPPKKKKAKKKIAKESRKRNRK